MGGGVGSGDDGDVGSKGVRRGDAIVEGALGWAVAFTILHCI